MDVYTYSDGGFRLERLANGWQVGRFAALEALGVAHLVTTRQGPDIQQVRRDPAAAGREIAAVLHLPEAAFLEQVHGAEVIVCATGGCGGCADGLVTRAAGLALVGKSGDCPIILIADRGGRAVGFAHASWRATVAGITPAVVRRMIDLGCEPGDLVACICPSAGPCCYEVGAEVRTAALRGIGPHAAPFFRLAERPRSVPHRPELVEQMVGGPQAHGTVTRGPERGTARLAPLLDPGAKVSRSRRADTSLPLRGRGMPVTRRPEPRGVDASRAGPLHFDLWRANACALARAGLAAGAIHVAGLCTICHNDLFPSHRCEGQAAGRFAAVIGGVSS